MFLKTVTPSKQTGGATLPNFTLLTFDMQRPGSGKIYISTVEHVYATEQELETRNFWEPQNTPTQNDTKQSNFAV